MRISSSATSVSWIPSEAVTGATKVPFELGVAHYDLAPPDVIDDLDALRRSDRFRFANELRGWVDVEGGRIVAAGQEGRGHIGSTTLRLGKHERDVRAFALSDIRPAPVVTETSARFVQTAGGRTGVPAPRRVRHAPFVQLRAPLAWTTLALTINADGSARGELVGASPFPRHWLYDEAGKLTAKSGMIEFGSWYRKAFGRHSPWGDEDSPALSTAVESALERRLSKDLMHGETRPDVRTVKQGALVTKQGTAGDEVFLVLDGVVRAEVDGTPVAEFGPGAVLGERAVLEGGLRTATVRALTRCKVAALAGEQLDSGALAELSTGHRRERQG
jgi:hypothetical protein